MYDGTLFTAFFHNLDILNDEVMLTAISKDDAWRLAKEEAEAFIERRASEDVRNSARKSEELTCEQFYSPYYKKHCWHCILSYEVDGYPIPFYFEILVDMQTGEIVQNANNHI